MQLIRFHELYGLKSASNIPWNRCLVCLGSNGFAPKERQHVRSFHDTKKQLEPVNLRANHIAVLGGGISGLASACFLAKELPHAKVTIFEKSNRLGGWLESSIHEIGGPNGGRVVFENGPRTLRHDVWAGFCTRELIEMLDLSEEIVSTPKDAPAARNRYMYYPDHLVRMPGPIPGAGLIKNVWQNLSNILREPIFNGLIQGMYKDYSASGHVPFDMVDESVGSFVSRKFNPSIAENLVSGVMHGIYAGDLYQLSARSLFPLMWHMNRNPGASIIDSTIKAASRRTKFHPAKLIEMLTATRDRERKPEDHIRGDIPQLKNSSVFSFKRGIQQFVEGLQRYIKSNPAITVKLNATVQHIQECGEEGKHRKTNIAVTESSGRKSSIPVDYVVSTLSAPTMAKVLSAPTAKAFNGYTYAVNVMVVNLFYRSTSLVPVKGFGYLIPRSVPYENNPECALGVIFGSDSSIGQDTAEGTKLTVMMGGHWWDGIPVSELPDSQSAIQMARNVLERHLGITAEPLISSAKLQLSAIPQYTIGHNARLKEIHSALTKGAYKGKVKVLGSWYTGVGVNDCITAARLAAFGIRQGFDQDCSGVESVAFPAWVIQNRSGIRFPSGSNFSKNI